MTKTTTKSKPEAKVADKSSKNYTIARSDDGTIQITFVIPNATIKSNQEKVAKELGKNIEVPGFRKGNAPLTKLIEHIPQDQLIQESLNLELPHLLGHAIKDENLRPATYPKFELISAEPDADWQVRATTCELPNVDLGDYKKLVLSLKGDEKIWTPKDGDPKDKPTEPSRAEKESKVIEALISNIKINIPHILIEEEANAKISQLLERLEKLSLNLDSYLSSVGKTPQTLRHEYEEQARNALSLDLILNEIAEIEKVVVPDSQIDEAIKTLPSDTTKNSEADNAQRRRLIESILRRKLALDKLTDLI